MSKRQKEGKTRMGRRTLSRARRRGERGLKYVPLFRPEPSMEPLKERGKKRAERKQLKIINARRQKELTPKERADIDAFFEGG